MSPCDQLRTAARRLGDEVRPNRTERLAGSAAATVAGEADHV
jgi:hypothetical protein